MPSASPTIHASADPYALAKSNGKQNLSDPESAGDAESDSIAWNNRVAEFLQVIQQSRPQMLRLAHRFTEIREDAEDIVQEAIMKAFRHLSNFRGESQMNTWLGAIVLNAGRESIRRRKGQVLLPLQKVCGQSEEESVSDFPDPYPNPEQNYAHTELAEILHCEIDELTPVCKAAIRMCALDGLSYLEAANALGVNASAIKSRISQGKRKLKRKICLRAGVRTDLAQTLEIT